MREIALDTETTGLSPEEGHRVIEIGCVELHNHVPTGRVFHQYINPERDVPEIATQISGLTEEFLKDFPVFSEIADDFLAFIEDAPLVIHNAKFDITFLNFELNNLGKPLIPMTRAIDTLLIARKKYPGSPASLDALSKRFEINIPREKHGALLDAQILAEIYIELKGGRQRILNLVDHTMASKDTVLQNNAVSFPARSFPVAEAELEAFTAMLKKIKQPLWGNFFEDHN